MPRYRVERREVHTQHFSVEADSAAHALLKVVNEDEDIEAVGELEYTRTLDPEEWDVYEEGE